MAKIRISRANSLGLDLGHRTFVLSRGEQANVGELLYADFDLLNGPVRIVRHMYVNGDLLPVMIELKARGISIRFLYCWSKWSKLKVLKSFESKESSKLLQGATQWPVNLNAILLMIEKFR